MNSTRITSRVPCQVGASRSRDAEASKAAILTSAERLFLEKGYADTAMSEIADDAGVTKGLIYHHFGSKELLWNEVKASCMQDYIDAQVSLFTGKHEVDVIRNSVVTYFRFLQKHPELLRLNAWLELEGPQPGNRKLDALTSAALDRMRELQRLQSFRADIDVAHLTMMLIALAEFWLANRKRISHVMRLANGGDDFDWRAEDERYIHSVVDVLLQGFAAAPAACRDDVSADVASPLAERA